MVASVSTVSLKLDSTWLAVPALTVPAPIGVPLSASVTSGTEATVVTDTVLEFTLSQFAPVARTRQ